MFHYSIRFTQKEVAELERRILGLLAQKDRPELLASLVNNLSDSAHVGARKLKPNNDK